MQFGAAVLAQRVRRRFRASGKAQRREYEVMVQSKLVEKSIGCMLGGTIGDAIGTPSEGKEYTDIEEKYGWIGDFKGTGTDDTIMKHLLSHALIRTGGYAGRDDWAAEWLSRWNDIFGVKVGKFFISVLHTAHKMRRHATPAWA